MPHTRHFTRRLIPALAAVIILAITVGTASARVLSASTQNLRASWASIELSNTVNEIVVRCPITVEGGFHSRTIAKVANSLTGYITRADINNAACTGGRATILNESLPWHITYQGFAGRLPAIESIRFNIIRLSFQLETAEGRRCLASTTTAAPAAAIADLTGGVITGMRADATRNIPLRDPPGMPGFCFFGSGRFSGTGSVTMLNTTTRVTITLI